MLEGRFHRLGVVRHHHTRRQILAGLVDCRPLAIASETGKSVNWSISASPPIWTRLDTRHWTQESGKVDFTSLYLTGSVGDLSVVLQASRCESGKHVFAADGLFNFFASTALRLQKD